MKEGSKFQAMSCVLTLLMRLRQACVHLALTRKVQNPLKHLPSVKALEFHLASQMLVCSFFLLCMAIIISCKTVISSGHFL